MIASLLIVIKLAEVDAMINKKEFCEALTQELLMAYPVQAVEILKTVDLHGLEKDDILPILGRFFVLDNAEICGALYELNGCDILAASARLTCYVGFDLRSAK